MIEVEVVGATGYLRLNRPGALNALDFSMIDSLTAGLAAHQENPAVDQIVVCAAHQGAFCAGGDVKQIRTLVLEGEVERAAGFFRDEYALNLAIARCEKPYIAAIDGAAMGGGIGISAHGSHRIVSERALLAMPETAIGLFPDVGGSYFLPRLKQHSGFWMGLSGARVSGVDAVKTGLATHFVPSETMPDLLQRLEQGERVDDAVVACSVAPADDGFDEQLAEIDTVFSAGSLEEVWHRLRERCELKHDSQLLSAALSGMEHGSPHALQVTFDLLSAGRTMTIEQCLEREFEVMMEMIRHPDFPEGVRAMLVDKDRSPVWAN